MILGPPQEENSSLTEWRDYEYASVGSRLLAGSLIGLWRLFGEFSGGVGQ